MDGAVGGEGKKDVICNGWGLQNLIGEVEREREMGR